ncbi:MAG: MotA/TolQ/ExbB proton channel family protein [candidate division Zixibacteria bacterium]|nr:MotA/TolQ/ExbB proton channel family protein [candidate division Zixibacteria bacterium]
MKQSVFITIVLVVSILVGFVIWTLLPEFIKEGGQLVALLIALSVMLFAFIGERLITLRKARGKSTIQSFFKDLVTYVQKDEYDKAIAVCDKQRGSAANILRAGIERYQQVKTSERNSEKRVNEVQRAIEEANALEVPLLERNLIAMSTIASIAVLVGLLGTTIGMIRAFAATSHRVGGVIDASQLARGISEALVNTAGGLFNAIIGIVAYNFFVNKVDAFNYTVDEASYEVMQLIKAKESESAEKVRV